MKDSEVGHIQLGLLEVCNEVLPDYEIWQKGITATVVEYNSLASTNQQTEIGNYQIPLEYNPDYEIWLKLHTAVDIVYFVSAPGVQPTASVDFTGTGILVLGGFVIVLEGKVVAG